MEKQRHEKSHNESCFMIYETRVKFHVDLVNGALGRQDLALTGHQLRCVDRVRGLEQTLRTVRAAVEDIRNEKQHRRAVRIAGAEKARHVVRIFQRGLAHFSTIP